jgi:hypothetical protein
LQSEKNVQKFGRLSETTAHNAVDHRSQFLSRNGVPSDERVTVISDDAGEFSKTLQGSQLARGRILDWFHIAMKFKAAQRSAFGSKMIEVALVTLRQLREQCRVEGGHDVGQRLAALVEMSNSAP